MSLKDISYLKRLQPLCSVEQNHLCKFNRRHHEEQFCENILNLDQWFRKNVILRYFLSEALAVILFSGAYHLCKFCREYQEEQFCEIILNLDQSFRRRCHLKYFLSRALATLVFCGAEPFMQFG